MSLPKASPPSTTDTANAAAAPTAAGDYATVRKQGVAAFMKATGRDEYVELLRRDRAAFFGPDGRPRADMVKHVACPACAEDDARPVFEKDGFGYVRCGSCRTLYVNPQLDEEHLVAYYRGSKAIARWNEVLLTPAQIDYDRKKFDKLLDAALGALPVTDGGRPARARVLDVGASVGTFCALARDRGCEALGVEISDDACARARDLYGLDLATSLEDLRSGGAPVAPGSVDVISFFEVVEHLTRPGDMLAAAHALLKPGGVLLALVGGNADSIAMRIMRERSLAFDMTRLAYYSPASFSSLLGRFGMSVEKTSSIIPEIDVALSYLRWDDPYKPELDDAALPAWFRSALERLVDEHTMGYKFWVVARKN